MKKNENIFCLNCYPNIIVENSINDIIVMEILLNQIRMKILNFILDIILTELRISNFEIIY